ncbi:hypothetical protein L6164_015658 [Bauhinia variegata]|uniref:Uncharacterized protein n=1 Tax=Bauhinia variegata TaxID=167791 RepID=A0ACB9NKY3_BAUVA|nr:hypothetical protein L6164_015658 [Bauhinia variegata]
MVRRTTKMVSDAYAGRYKRFTINNNMFTKMASISQRLYFPIDITFHLDKVWSCNEPNDTGCGGNSCLFIARSASGNACNMVLNTVPSMIREGKQEVRNFNSVTKFVDQLPSVMNEVTQGVLEFKPTPSENSDCISSYNVQHTLLVKFNLDTIDQTDILEEILRPRVESLGGTVEKVQFNGNHLIPCIQSS